MNVAELSNELAQLELLAHNARTEGAGTAQRFSVMVGRHLAIFEDLEKRLAALSAALRTELEKTAPGPEKETPKVDPDTCQHLQMESFADVSRFADQPDGTVGVDLTLWCKDCARPFSWKGLPKGVAMLSGVSTWDGKTVKLWARPYNPEDATALHHQLQLQAKKDAS